MDTDVLVVGGGPAGMTVAGDLARAGVGVVVVERWAEPNPASRAFAVTARTLELLDARGLAVDLVDRGAHAEQVDIFSGAGVSMRAVDSRYRFALVIPQTEVDAALGDYAQRHGADVRRGVELVSLTQDAEGVTATVRPHRDDPQAVERTIRARHLVAADGAHSTVRTLLGIEFPGRTALQGMALADVKLMAPPQRVGLSIGTAADRFSFLAPYGRRDDDGGRWYRSMTWDRHHRVSENEPVDVAEVADILRETQGTDFGLVEMSWNSRFHSDERQVEQYRHGRVFLVGDAAHVHSPVGGQGMNAGIQDAINLSWKLAAVIGGADDAVLDTYHDERHPVGRSVLQLSGRMLRMIVLRSGPARVLRDLLVPLLLRHTRIGRLLADRMMGTTLRYPAPAGADGSVGTCAEQIPLRATTLAELMREPGFVLLRSPGTPPAEGAVLQAERAEPGPTVLVRPDGYIAWAGSGDGWRSALAAWTGSSAGSSHGRR